MVARKRLGVTLYVRCVIIFIFDVDTKMRHVETRGLKEMSSRICPYNFFLNLYISCAVSPPFSNNSGDIFT